MRCVKCLVAFSIMVLANVCAAEAPLARAEDAIRYRRAVMVMVKWNYERLSQQAKGTIPFVRDNAQRQAALLEMLAKEAAEGFAPGSNEGDTKALPAVWTQWAKFRSLVDRLQSDTAKLREVTRTGDAAALKTQMNEVTRTCKSCHDDFKKS